MKTKILVITVLILLICTVSTFLYIDYKTTENSYIQAVEYIKQEKYSLAIDSLKNANKEKLDDGQYYYGFTYNDESKTYYKNSVVLHAYATAKLKYAEGNNMVYVNSCLEYIPENYNSEFSKEINSFKESFAPEYKTFLLEQERKRQEEFAKVTASYSDKLPYEGMSEQYIDYTMMGKHDKLIKDDDNDDFVYNVYYWNANNGDTMFAVTCINGKVHSVSKYYTWAYWTSDGKPKPYGTNSKSSSTKNYKKKSYDDPYNVNDYSDPEDFYDDNYDDFWDYEEAEDYYNSYHEDP